MGSFNYFFSAAHCLPKHTRSICRLLHGHTFTINLTVEGCIDREKGVVVFYSYLQKLLDKIVRDRMDHRVMLPKGYATLNGSSVTFSIVTKNGSKKAVLPKETVVLLDMPHVTIEYLSEHICERLWRPVSKAFPGVKRIILCLYETPNYFATAVRETEA